MDCLIFCTFFFFFYYFGELECAVATSGLSNAWLAILPKFFLKPKLTFAFLIFCRLSASRRTVHASEELHQKVESDAMKRFYFQRKCVSRVEFPQWK